MQKHTVNNEKYSPQVPDKGGWTDAGGLNLAIELEVCIFPSPNAVTMEEADIDVVALASQIMDV